jgi:hypothetical protein
MPHVVLLGDSIFDNAAYVRGGPDVVRQLREMLPAGWSATLLAVDGAVTRSVPAQIARLPADATHLVLSVGGNDALGARTFSARRFGPSAKPCCAWPMPRIASRPITKPRWKPCSLQTYPPRCAPSTTRRLPRPITG